MMATPEVSLHLPDDPTLTQLVRQVDAFPVHPLSQGYSTKRILEDGSFEELGTTFTIQDLALSHLYAGFAVLSRDMVMHLEHNPRDDADNFLRFAKEVHDIEFPEYKTQSFPQYDGLDSLPNTLDGIEQRGYATILPLRGPGLGGQSFVHEWTFKAGKRLFDKVAIKARETICGHGGPYRMILADDGLLGQADLPKTVVASVVIGAFAPAVFWYPLAAYAGLLVVKTGLKTFCEA
jgi:hypothetical protein